jgi:hypothetical protein
MATSVEPEPDFQTESELESAIASAIRSASHDCIRGVVLRGFGLDIAVFTERAGGCRACFFEIKAFAEHHGRCGFGNQRGEGNQIRLLFDEVAQLPRDQSQLRVFDPTIRWVLGNRSRPVGSRRFLFFTCKEAQNAAMGGVRGRSCSHESRPLFRCSDCSLAESDGVTAAPRPQCSGARRSSGSPRSGSGRRPAWS